MSEDCMNAINKIKKDHFISDNNKKVDKIVAVLNKFEVPFVELGAGTNRYAVLIDNYVFKFAMDSEGEKDNWMEFSLTQELQPFVTKAYECNGLVLVSEYVNLVTKSEFASHKEDMRTILSVISQSYLLGDVGTVERNFTNWGYRDNGEWVILDYAYLYRVRGEEMKCNRRNKEGEPCQAFLEYDYDYHSLKCPSCGQKYAFHTIRSRINKEFEDEEVEFVKRNSYCVTQPLTEINTATKDEPEKSVEDEFEDFVDYNYKYYELLHDQNNTEEENNMPRNPIEEISEEESMAAYMEALDVMSDMNERNYEEEQNPGYERGALDGDELAHDVEELTEILDGDFENIRVISESDDEDEYEVYVDSPYVDNDPYQIVNGIDEEDDDTDDDEEWFEEPLEIEDGNEEEPIPEQVEKDDDNEVRIIIGSPEKHDEIAESLTPWEDNAPTVVEEPVDSTESSVVDNNKDDNTIAIDTSNNNEVVIDMGEGVGITVKYTEEKPTTEETKSVENSNDENKSFIKIERPTYVNDDDDTDEYDAWVEEAAMENLNAKYQSKKRFN